MNLQQLEYIKIIAETKNFTTASDILSVTQPALSKAISKLEEELDVKLLGRGFAWLDTGTMESLIDAADFVKTIQSQQGIRISAPEEIAFRTGMIDRDKLMQSAEKYGKSDYGKYLKQVACGEI